MERGPGFERYARMDRPEAATDRQEEAGIEKMPYRELQELVVTKLTSVNDALNTERALAAEVRKMGARVSRDTAEGIMRLEEQKNTLLHAAAKYLEPVSRDANMAAAMGEEFLVVKPSNFEELMTDPGEMVVTDDMITIVQETAELQKEEAALAKKSAEIEGQMGQAVVLLGNLERRGFGEFIPTTGSRERAKEAAAALQKFLNGALRELEEIGASLTAVRAELSLGVPEREEREAA